MKAFVAGVGVILGCLLISLMAYVAIAYVVIHFVKKFW